MRIVHLALLAGCAGTTVVACRGSQASAVPTLYGAGLLSTGAWDFFVAFSSDERRVLFCRANDDFSSYDIYEARALPDGNWSAPQKPAFAAAWSNADPHIAPDGRTVFFVSNRPAPGATAAQATYDIWYATLQADGEWGPAQPLPAEISAPGIDEWSPSVAANGDLYFGSERAGGRGAMDLWVARRANGAYQVPENLGAAVNSAGNEVEPWIAPDGSYLIFSGKGRVDSVGGYDLYLARHDSSGWQAARPLDRVNSTWSDFNQSVSPDGRWLYFSSTRPLAGSIGARFDSPRDDRSIAGIGNGKGDIYRIALANLGVP